VNGRLTGMGYLPADTDPLNLPAIYQHIQPVKESSYTRNLVQGYAARFPEKVILFENSAIDQLPEQLTALA
jgi:hypothetical protein